MSIAVIDVDAAFESGLIAKLDAELAQRYPGQPIHGIDITEFRAASGCFVMARVGGKPVGCGAFRPLDAVCVEIKRMFTDAAFRKIGVARALLSALESEARLRGYQRAVLETGKGQPEAIALYRACGFADIAAFGEYDEDPRSVFLGKSL